jgi:hypothetical protein
VSIASMVAAGVKRQEELTTVTSTAAAGKNSEKDSAMEKLTKFIPSEVIAIYVAAVGILSPLGNTGKWVIYFICILLIPILIVINYYQQKRKQKAQANTNRRIASLLVLFALVAFTAWTCALPETPFLLFTPLAVKIGAVAVLVLAAVMTPLADALGILPKR